MEDIRSILQKYGQEHVLRFENELSKEEMRELEEQIKVTDFSILKLIDENRKEIPRGVITPLEAMERTEIEAREEEFQKAGVEALRQGKVAAVLLAGGMGTRLGCDTAKGMYDIGETKELYIFECLIHNLEKVVNKSQSYIHLFVMTSDLNHEMTVDFFKEHKYFGYPKEYIDFFCQEMAVTSDYQGHVYMETKNKISTSPNGNGGWFSSMMKSGMLKKAKSSGVEWLNIFAVDNVLQKMCDPAFIGATILENKVVGSKVVRKASPDEKVGVMCLEDGKPSVVEYYELTEEMRNQTNAKGDRVYNFGVILNYLFRIDELEEIVNNNLPLHLVEKKIKHIDAEGNYIEPTQNNGYKFEQLVLDMIHMAKNCLPFEVVREKEFAPIKNKTGADSVDTAKELLKGNGFVL